MSDATIRWAEWLSAIPADQKEILRNVVLEQVAKEAPSVRVTRKPTGDSYVKQPPAFVDVFNLVPLYDKLAWKHNVLVKGPKGDGKSLSVFTYAAINKIPIVVQECSEDTKKNELQGTQFLIGEETVFVLGAIPAAIDIANEVGHCILLFEELNALTPMVQKQLNAITDFRKMSSLPHIGKSYTLEPHAKLWVVGTMNPSVYGGTYDLNEDLKSRFEEVDLTYPSRQQEMHILRAVCPKQLTDDEYNKLLMFAKETRAEASGYALSTRDLVRAANLAAESGMATAAQLLAMKFEGADRKTNINRIKSIFGIDLLEYWGGSP